MAKKNNKQQGGVKIPRFIIITGKILEKISPSLTTKFVRSLFSMPMNHKPRPHELPFLNKAELSYIFVPEIGKKIAVYKWGNGPKKALIAHGWSSRPTQLHKFIEQLLERGYTVYGFDAPAHGKSSGKHTMMPEFVKTIEKIVEEYGPFDIAIGHSMGGISLLNVQANKHSFKKMVIIGAPDSIKKIFYRFIELMELNPGIAKRLIDIFEEITGKKMEEFHGSNLAKKIDIPVLIVHDENDNEVPLEDAVNNVKNLAKGQIYATKGLGHSRILKDDEVVKNVMHFLSH